VRAPHGSPGCDAAGVVPEYALRAQTDEPPPWHEMGVDGALTQRSGPPPSPDGMPELPAALFAERRGELEEAFHAALHSLVALVRDACGGAAAWAAHAPRAYTLVDAVVQQQRALVAADMGKTEDSRLASKQGFFAVGQPRLVRTRSGAHEAARAHVFSNTAMGIYELSPPDLVG